MEYKVGDLLAEGMLRVVDVIKTGGFGIVYICRYVDADRVIALKSFKDIFFKEEGVIRDFYREAEVWVKLGQHPNIVKAEFVYKIAGKPHVFMEYVDGGSLRERVRTGRLSLARSLDLGIQFCKGMIHSNNVDLGAGRKGIVHRDVKPENIMLTKEGTLKITDFGLIKALGPALIKAGTPAYMSPEQFQTMDVDTRSDIYSFGLVLYEMLLGRMPFPKPEDPSQEWKYYEDYHQNMMPKPPQDIDPSIPKELGLFVLKCLEKRPKNRYQSFAELKDKLTEFYLNYTKTKYEEITVREESLKLEKKGDNYYLSRRMKGLSLLSLGKHSEALNCFDEVLSVSPQDVKTWSLKGLALTYLGRFNEASECCNRALEIDSRSAEAWVCKGLVLKNLCKYKDAIRCYDRAIEANPTYLAAWTEKGVALACLGRFEEALKYYNKAIEIEPEDEYAWMGKGYALTDLGKYEKALKCYDRVTEIQPTIANAWLFKGDALANLGRFEEALKCYDKTIEIEPEEAYAWIGKGNALAYLGRFEGSLRCYERALKIKPREARSWRGKGDALANLGRFEEALKCYDKTIEIEPEEAYAWNNKGAVLDHLGRHEEALKCFERVRKLSTLGS